MEGVEVLLRRGSLHAHALEESKESESPSALREEKGEDAPQDMLSTRAAELTLPALRFYFMLCRLQSSLHGPPSSEQGGSSSDVDVLQDFTVRAGVGRSPIESEFVTLSGCSGFSS